MNRCRMTLYLLRFLTRHQRTADESVLFASFSAMADMTGSTSSTTIEKRGSNPE